MNLSVINNILTGVHIEVIQDNQFIFNVTKLKKSNNEVNIAEANQTLSSFLELEKEINKVDGIALSISGKNILSKLIEVNNNENVDNKFFINKILPNANNKKLYIQKIKLSETIYLVTIAKKDLIDNILTELKKNNVYIIDFFLGISAFVSIIRISDMPEGIFNIGNYKVEVNNYRIKKLERNITNTGNKKYIFLQKEFDSESVLPFAVAFNYFFPVKAESNHNVSTIYNDKIEYKYKKIFKNLLVLSLSFLFILLFANFIFFTIFSKKYSNIKQTFNEKIELINKLDSLDEELTRINNFIKNNNIQNNSKFSFFADKTASTLPDEIYLEKITFNPVIKKIRKDKEILTDKNKILIQGVVKKSTDIGAWINILENEKWVKKVKIKNYFYNSKKKNGKFEILIDTDEI